MERLSRGAGAPREPALPSYSFEPHGAPGEWALYHGRSADGFGPGMGAHGARLCQMYDFDRTGESLRAAILAGLNRSTDGVERVPAVVERERDDLFAECREVVRALVAAGVSEPVPLPLGRHVATLAAERDTAREATACAVEEARVLREERDAAIRAQEHERVSANEWLASLADRTRERDEARAEREAARASAEAHSDLVKAQAFHVDEAKAALVEAQQAAREVARPPDLLAYFLGVLLGDQAYQLPEPPAELGSDPVVRAAWLIGHMQSHA